ncbi:hypothetical protein AAHA92_23049 [Salvia divinorum]|uniref:Uncharacterized protein n=1 Tax=Salvia divinorum TaxID=28513 RepID=A0ABD1GR04_SALDI
MSTVCSHVGGTTAYVNSFHPNCSPAAIMTTAKPTSSRVDKDVKFAYGEGQVNPTGAISAGVLQDMSRKVVNVGASRCLQRHHQSSSRGRDHGVRRSFKVSGEGKAYAPPGSRSIRLTHIEKLLLHSEEESYCCT